MVVDATLYVTDVTFEYEEGVTVTVVADAIVIAPSEFISSVPVKSADIVRADVEKSGWAFRDDGTNFVKYPLDQSILKILN